MQEASVETRDDILVVLLKASELSDEEQIKRVGAELAECVEQVSDGKLLLDLANVAFMSSLMLGQLAVLGKTCKARDIALKVCNISPRIKETLQVVGFDLLIDLHDKEESALAGFREMAGAEADAGNAAEENDSLLSCAKGGDADAQFELARKCEEGTAGIPQDFEESLRWYRAAAEQGHANAQNTLGVWHAYGINVPQDYEQAIEWYRKAADQGHSDAQFSMGMSHSFGLSIPQDHEAAVRYYNSAAEGGNVNAQASLGAAYLEGSGVEQDTETALRWFRTDADQGHADAQFSLAWCYETGTGVEADQQEAANWYQKAADQGHEQAIAALEGSVDDDDA